jgi:hypothetical protein
MWRKTGEGTNLIQNVLCKMGGRHTYNTECAVYTWDGTLQIQDVLCITWEGTLPMGCAVYNVGRHTSNTESAVYNVETKHNRDPSFVTIGIPVSTERSEIWTYPSATKCYLDKCSVTKTAMFVAAWIHKRCKLCDWNLYYASTAEWLNF